MAMTLEDLVRQQKQKIAESSNQKIKTTKPPQGKSRWRILPSWRKDPEDIQFFHTTGTHFVKDKNMKLRVVVSCVDATYDKACPICDAIRDALSDAEDDDQIKVLKESQSRRTFLVNAIRTDEGSKEPVILELTKTTFAQVLDNIEEHGPIFDPKDGLDIVIDRQGTGFNTEYGVVVASKAKSAPVPKSVLMKLHDLDEYVKADVEARLDQALGVVGGITGAVIAESTRKALTGPKESADAEDVEHEDVDEEDVPDEDEVEETEDEDEDKDLSDEDLQALIDDL